MEVRILDKNFVDLAIVEKYQSFIWTDRYNQCGDFELCAPVTENWVKFIEIGNYVTTSDSDRMMIIEGYEITTNVEEGNLIKITGRSLESILSRRIVWAQTIIYGDAQAIFKKLITDAIISPALSERKIDNFIFEEIQDDYIAGFKAQTQYTGDNIYDVVCDICRQLKIGFKITLNSGRQFVFKLFRGVDRSDTVTFANEYNNLINTDYTNNHSNEYNVTLVAGEGEGPNRKTSVVGTSTGIDRRELFTDARDLSSTGTTAADYLIQLQQRGREKLAEYQVTEGFEGEVEPEVMYKYGTDYFIGDIVKFQDVYGNFGTPRISEFTISNDESNGYYCYPTFVVEE